MSLIVLALMILQGSVATHMRCVEIFNKCFTANVLENLTIKNRKNWLSIERVTTMSMVSPFLEHDVGYNTDILCSCYPVALGV